MGGENGCVAFSDPSGRTIIATQCSRQAGFVPFLKREGAAGSRGVR